MAAFWASCALRRSRIAESRENGSATYLSSIGSVKEPLREVSMTVEIRPFPASKSLEPATRQVCADQVDDVEPIVNDDVVQHERQHLALKSTSAQWRIRQNLQLPSREAPGIRPSSTHSRDQCFHRARTTVGHDDLELVHVTAMLHPWSPAVKYAGRRKEVVLVPSSLEGCQDSL